MTLLAAFTFTARCGLQGQGAAAAYRAAHESEILAEFAAFLAVPNVAADSVNIRRSAALLQTMMERRGLNPRLLESPGAPPAVVGEWKVPGATRTLVIYAHYDGQPTVPAKWTSGHPWTPELRSAALERGGIARAWPARGEHADSEARIYARSASDDKGGVMAILTAVDALKAAGKAPTSNITFFFEGEEEAGSPHLQEVLRANAATLKADAWVFVDGPVHQSGAKQVMFGVRGDMHATVTVYGPNRPLHSGHYGNWAPNPAERLARLLTSMKNDSGRVLINGWYDDVEPLGAAERSSIAALAAYDSVVARELGIARPDGSGKSLAELIALPSLNVNGIASAEVGADARNVIPTTATVVLDLRLVRGNDHDRQFQKLVDHVRGQGYLVLNRPPTAQERATAPLIAMVTQGPGSYNASRTPMDLPLARSLIEAIGATTPRPVVLLPTSGGSLPLIYITDILHAPTLMVPIANYDNNQHAEDENLRLGNFWSGIETIVAILGMR
jgi:acetylornithine deacetylase/succinyl-diaminopimelate desuccinylase-like protein